MSEKSFRPSSRQEQETLSRRKITNFSRGMAPDVDPTALGAGQVSHMENILGKKNGFEGRKGTTLLANIELPFTPVVASKNGSEAVMDWEGLDTTVQRSVAFDEIPNRFFMITHYGAIIGGDSYVGIKVLDGDTTTTTPGGTGKLRDRLNASFFDPTTKRLFLLMGKTLFVGVITGEQGNYSLDPIGGSNWLRIPMRGTYTPVDAFSRFYRIGEALFLSNAGGLFRISLGGVKETFAWRANGTVPTVKPVDISRADVWQYGYRYIVTHSALKGGHLSGDRTNGYIEQETCPREITGDDKDYSVVYSSVPPSETKSLLGGALSAYRLEKYHWRSLKKNAFGLMASGTVKTCLVDYTNVGSLAEVIKITQTAINNITSNIQISVTTDAGMNTRFLLTVLAEDGTWRSRPEGIVNAVDSDIPVDATTKQPLYSNTASESFMLDPTTAVIDTTQNIILERLQMYDDDLSYRPKDVFTHYTVYRTRDISAAEDPLGQLSAFRLVNDQNLFIWTADVPAIHAFSGYFDPASGEIVVVSGGVSKQDVGSVVTMGGRGDQVQAIIDAVTDRGYICTVIGTVSLGNVGWSGQPIPMSIGGKHHWFLSRSYGSNVVEGFTGFTTEDVGHYLFWENGSCSLIIGVTDGGQAVTSDDTLRTEMCAGMIPTTRNFCDTISDEVLMARAKSWPLRNRFYTRLKNTTLASVIPGFFICANRGFGDWIYCSTANLYDIGYYHALGQFNDAIKEDIREISEINGLIVIRTPKSTYTVDPTQAAQGGDPKFNESFFVLPDPVCVSPTIGVLSSENVVRIDQTKQLVFTGEPAVRFFDGTQYGYNVAEGSVQRTHIDRLFPKTVLAFDPAIGIVMWGSRDGFIGEGK